MNYTLCIQVLDIFTVLVFYDPIGQMPDKFASWNINQQYEALLKY